MRIGERLVRDGLLTPEQLEQALRAQVIRGGRLGTVLVELGFVGIDALAEALGRAHGLPAALQRHFDGSDRLLQSRLSAELAATWCAIPIRRIPAAAAQGRELVAVAAMDPLSADGMRALEHALGGPIVVAVTAELRVLYWLESVYGIPRPTRFVRLPPGLERVESVAAARASDERGEADGIRGGDADADDDLDITEMPPEEGAGVSLSDPEPRGRPPLPRSGPEPGGGGAAAGIEARTVLDELGVDPMDPMFELGAAGDVFELGAPGPGIVVREPLPGADGLSELVLGAPGASSAVAGVAATAASWPAPWRGPRDEARRVDAPGPVEALMPSPEPGAPHEPRASDDAVATSTLPDPGGAAGVVDDPDDLDDPGDAGSLHVEMRIELDDLDDAEPEFDVDEVDNPDLQLDLDDLGAPDLQLELNEPDSLLSSMSAPAAPATWPRPSSPALAAVPAATAPGPDAHARVAGQSDEAPDGAHGGEASARTRADSSPDTRAGAPGAERRRFVEPLSEGRASQPTPQLGRIAIVRVPQSAPGASTAHREVPLDTVDRVVSAIRRATGRDRVGDLVVGAVRDLFGDSFDAGVILIVRGAVAIGWKGFARGRDPTVIDALAVPLDRPSVLQNAFHEQRPVLGAVRQPSPLDRRLWAILGDAPPRTLAVLPVSPDTAVACLVYAHSVDPPHAVGPEVFDALRKLARATSRAFARLIRAAQR